MVAAAGVKVAEIVQLEPALSEVPQVLVSAKLEALVPPSVMTMLVRGALPLLVRVMLPAEDAVPTVLVRLSVVPESAAPGCVGGVVVAVPELLPQPASKKENERATTASLLRSIETRST